MKITSAHAIAFTALVASVGGGFAVAHNGDTDKIHLCVPDGGGTVSAVPPETTCPAGQSPTDVRVQNAGYHTKTIGGRELSAGRFSRVSEELRLPADGESYLLSGKLVAAATAGAPTVTCRLTPTDNSGVDVARATLRRRGSATLAFHAFGKTDGRPGQVATAEISCRPRGGRVRVAHVRITAHPVNTVSKGVPVP